MERGRGTKRGCRKLIFLHVDDDLYAPSFGKLMSGDFFFFNFPLQHLDWSHGMFFYFFTDITCKIITNLLIREARKCSTVIFII